MRGRAGNAGMPEGGPGLGETWQTAAESGGRPEKEWGGWGWRVGGNANMPSQLGSSIRF